MACGLLATFSVLGVTVALRHDNVAVHTAQSSWWPLGSWLSSAEESAQKPPVQPHPMMKPAAAKVPRVEDTKQALLTSSVFLKKEADLCRSASRADLQTCKQIAAERMFCAMFMRHLDKFK